MSWKSGDFDRASLPGVVRRFAPAHAAESLHVIDLQTLWDKGKRLILLDVDNTLVQWKGLDFSSEVVAWIERAKAMGFGLCIISNTTRVERLADIAQRLGVETVRGRFKPSTAMFRLALIKFKAKPEEAVMVGDQMMTDVLGANRSGIDAIWVRKMEGKEFGGTRINRQIERFLASIVYRALVLPEKPVGADAPAIETPLGKQLLRFVIVGGTSFVIDTLLTVLLMRWVHVGGEPMGVALGRWLIDASPGLFAFANSPSKAAAPILGGIASFVAMFNSFWFNRLWTFEARGKAHKVQQAARFYAVAVSGAVLSALIFSAVFNALPLHDGRGILLAKVVAAALVAIWNFVGQRTFAFKAAKP